MKLIATALFFSLISLFAIVGMTVPASAQNMATCEAQAVSKDGKPLTGAARTSSITKCMQPAKAACEAKAIDKNGKALAGAAKESFLKKCEAGS